MTGSERTRDIRDSSITHDGTRDESVVDAIEAIEGAAARSELPPDAAAHDETGSPRARDDAQLRAARRSRCQRRQRPRLGDSPCQNLGVWRGCQLEVADVDGIVPCVDEQLRQSGRQVLVDQEFHEEEVSGSVRSRRASAAKRRASWMSSGSRSGKSARISSLVMPSATMATTVATGIRRSRRTRDPAHLAGIDVDAVEGHRASVSVPREWPERIHSAGVTSPR